MKKMEMRRRKMKTMRRMQKRKMMLRKMPAQWKMLSLLAKLLNLQK